MKFKASLLTTTIASLLLAGTASTAAAQELNDRWEISAAYFQPKMELDFTAEGTLTDGSTSRYESGRTGIDERFSGAQVEAMWRPTQRQRVVLGAYRIDDTQRYGLQTGGTVTQEGTTVDYDVDGRARLDTEFSLYRLGYGFDVLQHERVTVTALAGVYGAKIKSTASTSGFATVDGETYDLEGRAELNETRYAPGLGLASEWRPADRWNVRSQVQGFKTSWGDFSNDGHFIHAQAQVGYDFTPKLTGFVGYDWFELELREDSSASGTFEGVDYSLEGRLAGRLRVHGPTVGIRAHF